MCGNELTVERRKFFFAALALLPITSLPKIVLRIAVTKRKGRVRESATVGARFRTHSND